MTKKINKNKKANFALIKLRNTNQINAIHNITLIIPEDAPIRKSKKSIPRKERIPRINALSQ